MALPKAVVSGHDAYQRTPFSSARSVAKPRRIRGFHFAGSFDRSHVIALLLATSVHGLWPKARCEGK
jgi:hypothetical protein